MYATLHQEDSTDVENKKTKGVARAIIKKYLCFNLYKKTLFEKNEIIFNGPHPLTFP